MSEAQRIEQEAAAWLIAREEPGWDAAREGELAAWLDTSFAHKAAFWRLEDSWRQADRIAAIGPDAERRSLLRAPATEADWLTEDDVAAFALLGSGDRSSAAQGRAGTGDDARGDDRAGAGGAGDAKAARGGAGDRRGWSDAPRSVYGEPQGFARWRPYALAASLLLALFLGFQIWQAPGGRDAGLEALGPVAIAPTPPERARLVETGTEKKKMVSLPDGSRIELAASSTIHADIRPEARHIWLDNGEAYFDVKHANDVPFVIHAGSRVVTVLGTRFSVRRDGDQVRVNVVEGRVRVDEIAPAGSAAVPLRSTIITGGDLAVARGSSTMVEAAAPDKVEGQLGWRKGVLNFDRMTLGEAAAEFNRFNEKKLVVDADVADTRIGGTFKTDNVSGFAELLRDAYGLKVEENAGSIKISD